MREAWEHAKDDNVSIPTPIVSLLFLLESCRYDASLHMFHNNIRHELCLHGGMVLKKRNGRRRPERSRMPESGRFNHINGRIWSLRIEGASTSGVFPKSHQFAVHQDVQLEEAQSPHYFSHHAFFAIVVSAIVCVWISSSQRTQTRRVKTSSHARERGTRVNLNLIS